MSNAKLFQIVIFKIDCTALPKALTVLNDQLIKTVD